MLDITLQLQDSWTPFQRNHFELKDTASRGKNLPRKVTISDGCTGNTAARAIDSHTTGDALSPLLTRLPLIIIILSLLQPYKIDGFMLVPRGNGINIATPGSWWAIKDHLSPLQIIAGSTGSSPQLPPQPAQVSLAWMQKSQCPSCKTTLLMFIVSVHFPRETRLRETSACRCSDQMVQLHVGEKNKAKF